MLLLFLTVVVGVMCSVLFLVGVSFWWKASERRSNIVKAVVLVATAFIVYGFWWLMVISMGVANVLERYGVAVHGS